MKKPFTKALQEFLINRCGQIVFSEVSPQYQKTKVKIEEISTEIKPLLSAADQKKLLQLDDRYNDRLTEVFNEAYLKGFTESIRFIKYIQLRNRRKSRRRHRNRD